MKILLKQISEYAALYRDSRTGIAWVENGSVGCEHSAHANIDSTGSVAGMKKLGYWRRDDRTIRCRGAIYNIDTLVITDDFDQLAADHCHCGGKHERKHHESF